MTAPAPSATTRSFLRRSAATLFIGGEWFEAHDGRLLAVVDPATAEPLCNVAWAGETDVDLAVAAARRAFDDGPWSRLPPAKRARLLYRLADLLEEHADELAEIECLDNGKPKRMAERVDLPSAIELIRYFAGWPTKINGETVPVSVPAMHVYTRKEPIGVCGLIIPWNFPLLTAVQKIAPALAAGNVVVLKPAEQTPLAAVRLAELSVEAGFPDGVLNVLTGDGSTGAALVAHGGVDKVSFTGSTAVGREIAASAGGGLKRITLELGGKSPNIILPDADLAAAVSGSYLAMYFNTGQVCQAGSRLFVHRDQFDDVVGALAERAMNARLGPGLDPATQVGPVVSDDQYHRVRDYIRSGIDAGAEVLAGGDDEIDGAPHGYFVRPTLFAGVTNDMRIAQEEIFGPVLVAMPYNDLDEVARRANETEYGLAAYVWTRDLTAAHTIAAKLRAGTVFVNTATVSDPAAPFGGVKASGFGRENGRENLNAYLETKTVWISLR